MPKIPYRFSQYRSVYTQVKLTVWRVLQKELKPHGFDHDGLEVAEVIKTRSTVVTTHSGSSHASKRCIHINKVHHHLVNHASAGRNLFHNPLCKADKDLS